MSEAGELGTVTVGILGLGNMGGAIAAGLHRAGFALDRLHGFDPAPERCATFPGQVASSGPALVAASDVVVVAVKPHLLGTVLPVALAASRCDVLVSVAAGVRLETLRTLAGDAARSIVRVMPNTAAAIGRSTSALVGEPGVAAADKAVVDALFSMVGEVAWLASEDLMHVATAVVGSAPAFVYVVAEALADGAVMEGLPRTEARRLVASMIRGAGELLLSHDDSPAELKDRVASPGGTTIRGLVALEEGGLRATLVDAVVRTAGRSRELG